MVLASFFAALHGYRNSVQQLDEMFDQELASVALLISGVIDNNAELPPIIESKFVFQVFNKEGLISQSSNSPEYAIVAEEDFQGLNSRSAIYGYSTFFAKRWRTHSIMNERYTVSVAQPLDSRVQSAESILLVTITPIIAAIPLIAALIYYIVHKSLNSLTLLSKQITRRNSDDLSAIVIQNPPIELAPVIDKLNQLLQRVDASLEREKQLTANAAHELRTPISVLAISAHNLMQDFKDNKMSALALQELSQNVDRIAHVIEQMIALYRFTPEQFSVNKRPCNLQTILQDVISQNFTSIEDNQQSVSLDANQIWVLGEAFALQTMFENILKNAIKYSGQGAEIIVEQTFSNELVIVSIHDSGKGVDEEEYEKLLARFYRASNQSNTHIKGSGLGLSIVKHICDLHGGNICFSKSSLGGLSVSISLPVHKGNDA